MEKTSNNALAQQSQSTYDRSIEDRSVERCGGGSDSINNVLANLQAQLSRIGSDISSLRSEVSSAKNENKSVIKAVSNCEETLKQQIIEMKRNLIDNNKEILSVKKENLSLKGECTNLNSKINQMQQLFYFNGIRILNIPVTENENLLDIISKLSEVIQFNLNKDFIATCFRLNRRNDSNPPPIILKFMKNHDKIEFLRLKKLKHDVLNSNLFSDVSPNKKIFITENMSPHYAKLYNMSRELVRNNVLRYAWFRNNKLFVRVKENSPSHIIDNTEDLSKITEQCFTGDDHSEYEEIDTDSSVRSGQILKSGKKRKVKVFSRTRPQAGSIQRFFRPSEQSAQEERK